MYSINNLQRLKNVLSTFEERQHIRTFFELVHELYEYLELEKDSEQIALTIRDDHRNRLTLNLNGRLFLGATNQSGEDRLIFALYEKDAEQISDEIGEFRHDEMKFDVGPDEEQSYTVSIAADIFNAQKKRIKTWWFRCAKDYLPRQSRSNYRHHHAPILGELTHDEEQLHQLVEQPEEYYFSKLKERYKSLVEDDQNEPEIYKWQNVKHYQESLDLEADDFHSSLKSALAKSGNLIYMIPKGYIKKAAKYFPEQVRENFTMLYDEAVPLKERMAKFSDWAESLEPEVSKKHGKELNVIQDERTLSYYLSIWYPERYPLYKNGLYQYLLDMVTDEEPRSAGEKYFHYMEIGEGLLPLIEGDTELIDMIRDTLDDDCYQGDPKWLIFQDILWRTKQQMSEEVEETEEAVNTERFDIVKNYLEEFAQVADGHFAERDWPLSRLNFFREFFQKKNLETAEWEDFQEIPDHIHAYQSLQIAGKNAFGRQNHDLEQYKKSFHYLAYGEDDLATRLNTLLDKESEYHLKFVGESFYAEVVGYIFPEEYVFYNTRDEEAIRFLDLDIERNPGEPFGDFFVRYNQALAPLKSMYEEIVGQRTETTVPLELDQFFSWIYENHVKKSIPAPSENGSERNYWWLNAHPDIWRFADNEVGQEKTYTSHNSKGNKRQIYKNFEQVEVGDLVIGYESTPVKKIKAILEITEPLHVDDEEEEKISFRLKQFTPNQPTWEELKSRESLQECSVLKNNQGSLFSLTASEFDTLYELAFKDISTYPTYSKTDALEVLFLPEEELDRIVDLLDYKKNIILQGPPGTGKTFLAKRLAWLQLGAKDESRIATIQFHPSYSYEDFIRGYRPTEDHFELKDGLFLEICKQAKSDPDNPYYVIIDEINRGNLSKIFGELMMLIEKDKRGPEFTVTLPYKKQDESDFYIPENLYLIGTMNTADRSLALVDYALRRRFVFIDIMPNFGEKFQNHLQSFGVDDTTVELIVERLRSLNAEISEESGLGKGFQIGHSYFCRPNGNDVEWYRNIVEYEIIPLLNEYWFDKPEKVESLREDLLSI